MVDHVSAFNPGSPRVERHGLRPVNNRSQRGFPTATLGPQTEASRTDVEKCAPESIRLFFHSTNQAGELIGKYDLAPLSLRSSTACWQGSHPDRPRDQPYTIARR